MLKFDKEKYVRIMHQDGLPAALTALHRDQSLFEFQTFEGKEGFKPEDWREMSEVRTFSRELWEMAYQESQKTGTKS